MKQDVFKIRVRFTEPVLGAVPYNKEIYTAWIIKEAKKQGVELTPEQIEEELASIEELEEKGWTGFHRDEDRQPFEYNHTWTGLMKEACSALRRCKGTESSKKGVRAFKKIINTLIEIAPRKIPYILPDGYNAENLAVLERPLRASTPKGERVTLVRSDIVPAGAGMEFQIHVAPGAPVTEALLDEWLEHSGKFIGYRQFRSGGYGRFELLSIEK